MGYITDTADAIAETLEHELPDAVTVDAYESAGHGFDTPYVVVGLPDLELPTYEQQDTELGAYDWPIFWPVTLCVDFDGEHDSTRQALTLTELIITAFHADPTLGGTVEDARVTDIRSGYNDANSNRRLIVVEFDVATFSTRAT